MSDERLALARSSAVLPELRGPVLVLGPASVGRVAGLADADLLLAQSSHKMTRLAERAGLKVQQELPETAPNAIVVLPRAKAEALHLIGMAAETVRSGWIIVDGQKTDGIDSILKLIKKTGVPAQSYAKAHGKAVWFAAEQAAPLRSWRAEPKKNVGGWWTAPGVFSADDVDPASDLLIASLPELTGIGADLGAGWGYLTCTALQKNIGIDRVYLVEDNAIALDCARRNTVDARAEFQWHDALDWGCPEPLDWIIMNPPFHEARDANPDLGRAFIRAASKLLKPSGRLYMVANAHLPYEDELDAQFRSFAVMQRTPRFKVFSADAKRGVARNR